MNHPIIRKAQVKDAPALADLVIQLGYPANEIEITNRLDQAYKLDHHAVFIAEVDEKVVGWVHIYLCPVLISQSQAQLGGLVVDSEHRGRGVGRQLMENAEQWAREHGCELVSVYTNVIRDDAHRFYSRLGYQQKKTEHFLVKPL